MEMKKKRSIKYGAFLTKSFIYVTLIVLIISLKDNIPTMLPQMNEAYHGWLIIIGSIMLWDFLISTKAKIDKEFKTKMTEKFVGTSLLTKLKYSILIITPVIGTIVLVHGAVIA